MNAPVDDFRLVQRAASSPAYARRSDAEWREAYPAHRLAFVEPARFGRERANFAARLDEYIPSVGVLCGSNLFVAGESGTLCTADGTVLNDHSWYRGHFDEMQLSHDAHVVRALRGRVLTLASDWAKDNYAHFLLDVLPRLALAEACGYDIHTFDHVVVGVPNAFCASLLQQLGIDPATTVAPERDVAITGDVLVAPTFPGMRRNIEAWAATFLYDRLRPPLRAERRRLYLPRTSRKPDNDAKLRSILERHQFHAYAPDADPFNQAQVFAQASIIAGAHGAALANVIFAQPGTTVFELVPSDHVQPYFASLSMSRNLPYRYLVGKSRRNRGPKAVGPSPYDFHVDEAVFDAAIVALTR